MFSLNGVQVRRMAIAYPVGAKRIERLLADPSKLLSTILIGNTIINVLVALISLRLAIELGSEYAAAISVVVTTLLLLVFGEYGPKRIATLWPEVLARAYAPLLRFFEVVLLPLRLLLNACTVKFKHAFHPRGHILSHAETSTIVDMGQERGVLDEHERYSLRVLLRLEHLYVSEIMTPRVDIQGIDLSHPDATQIEQQLMATRTRYSVLYRGSLDDIEGFADQQQYLLDPRHNLKSATLPTFYIPEQCTLDKLLLQFLSGRRRLAIVVDEYGGTAGLVTRGDILEVVTGMSSDGHAARRHVFERLSERSWLVDGNLNLEEVNRRLGLHLDGEGSDRLSGWLTSTLERMPTVGEKVQAEGFVAQVRHMRQNRISTVQLTLDPDLAMLAPGRGKS